MIENGKKVVIGKKQTLRAITRNEVSIVYVSEDADMYVTQPIIDVCTNQNIEIIYFDNMRELGKACGIDVNAAAAAVLK
jgi:large subunit ribosomal protein L7A